MGVKLSITKASADLYPVGELLLRIVSNELDKASGKVKINFVVAQGPLTGKPISRKFNAKLSQMSDLGKFLVTLGIQVNDNAAGQELDLDALNTRFVWGYNTHYPLPNGNGVINSLTQFRSAEGGAVPQPQPQPQAQQAYVPPQPVQQVPPQQFAPQQYPAQPQQYPTQPQQFVPPQPAPQPRAQTPVQAVASQGPVQQTTTVPAKKIDF